MKYEPGFLFGLALQSIPEPRKVARDLFDLNYDRATLWMMLALVLVGGAALSVISQMLFPVGPDFADTILAQPMVMALSEATIAVLTVFLIFFVSRAAGGTGRFQDGLVTIIWLNFVILLLQVAVLFLSLFAPGLAAILALTSGVAGLWIMSHFVAEAHGFRSAGRVFLGIMMTGIAAAVVVSIVLTLAGFGVAVSSGDLGNV